MHQPKAGGRTNSLAAMQPFSRTRRVRGSLRGYADAVPFEELGSQMHLVVDRVYCGGPKPGYGADPLSKLKIDCPNEGGFRAIGAQTIELSSKGKRCTVLVLSSNGTDPDWPDHLDAESGDYIYYGDNKHGGRDIHGTSKGGNLLLSQMFEIESTRNGRSCMPPTLVFEKTGIGRDTRFLGLAVPTSQESDGLIAIWRQTSGIRFQNYKARFRILDCNHVPVEWIRSLVAGNSESANTIAPKAWSHWVKSGKAVALHAPKTVQYRAEVDQLPEPTDSIGLELLQTIRDRFKESPHDFEFVAAEIFRLIEPRVYDLEVTKMSADGGRDAIGRLRVGGDESESDGVFLEFALEAKAWAASNGLGVKATSRLISRLKHRQFGVIVTTSYVSKQAYQEIREDSHPVVIVAARDIAQILRSRGISTTADLITWIDRILGID
jgi:hypothetical protein